MQFFAEAHYYDGGFKTELVPNGLRPSFLPSPELVGLRSTEAELAAGEFAIEIAFFPGRTEPISWLACYTRGRDLKLGDRGTYCGVGVWLVGAQLKHARHLVSFLTSATECLAGTAVLSTDARSKLISLVSELPGLGWCLPFTDKHVSRTPVEDAPTSTSYLVITDNSKNGFDLVTVDMLGHLLTAPHSYTPIRRLYFLGHSSRIFVRPTEQFSFRNALTYAEHIIHSVGCVATSRAKKSQTVEITSAKKVAG